MKNLLMLLCMAMLAVFIANGNSAFAAQDADKPEVLLQTNLGDILLQLDSRKAPITCANFIQYVKSGHYDGTIFHRVIKGFMIQGGGMTPDLKEKHTLAPIKNESNNGLKNKKYTIAMARTSDPNSATAQFFINTKDNDFLDYKKAGDGVGYAVFGKVVKGQNVVDEIEKAVTGSVRHYDDVPKTPVVIKKAEVIE